MHCIEYGWCLAPENENKKWRKKNSLNPAPGPYFFLTDLYGDLLKINKWWFCSKIIWPLLLFLWNISNYSRPSKKMWKSRCEIAWTMFVLTELVLTHEKKIKKYTTKKTKTAWILRLDHVFFEQICMGTFSKSINDEFALKFCDPSYYFWWNISSESKTDKKCKNHGAKAPGPWFFEPVCMGTFTKSQIVNFLLKNYDPSYYFAYEFSNVSKQCKNIQKIIVWKRLDHYFLNRFVWGPSQNQQILILLENLVTPPVTFNTKFLFLTNWQKLQKIMIFKNHDFFAPLWSPHFIFFLLFYK